MRTRRTKEKNNYLETKRKHFIRNAYLIIDKMVELNKRTNSRHAPLVDEILHSIFFLGNIRTPSISPKEILPKETTYNDLKNVYPQPFDLYSSHVPRRSPFSCVLDMFVLVEGQRNEDKIKQTLQEFILPLKEGPTDELVSSTICVSQKPPNGVRYYGVSMSTSGANPGQIMVAASCCRFWDDYVAGAVMTYHSKDMKQHFDGTIRVPEYVRCKAFGLSTGQEIPPCISCGNMFGFSGTGDEWPYGNCAEAESLSNLLKNEKDVKAAAKPTSVTYTNENRQWAEKKVLKELQTTLGKVKIKRWNSKFYIPQTK